MQYELCIITSVVVGSSVKYIYFDNTLFTYYIYIHVYCTITVFFYNGEMQSIVSSIVQGIILSYVQ
jgi:hypothetical protein